MKEGPFVVIEALDAGGSQTQTDRLARRLKRSGVDVLQLHFPQEDQPTGQLIYEKFLHDKNRHNFTRREQAILYIQDFYSKAAAITEHRLRKRSLVITDRFYTSTLAYQTIGLSGRERSKAVKWLKWLAEQGTPRLPKPDLVIYLDTPVAISLQHLRGQKKDYFENRQKLTAIRNSYLRLANDEKWTIINSVDDNNQQRPVQIIQQEIWPYVQNLL